MELQHCHWIRFLNNVMNLPKRKNIRLKGYDYSQNGLYFVTICAYKRQHLFGKIVGQGLCSCRHQNIDYTSENFSLQSACELSSIGQIVEKEIINTEKRFKHISITDFIIMPNHIHMIIWINNIHENNLNRSQCKPRQEQSPCPTIGDFICALKSMSTKRANEKDNVKGRKIWQYRYHDHIIRNEKEYQVISKYICENPQKWEQDCYHPQNNKLEVQI